MRKQLLLQVLAVLWTAISTTAVMAVVSQANVGGPRWDAIFVLGGVGFVVVPTITLFLLSFAPSRRRDTK